MNESSLSSSFGNINFITNPDVFPIGFLPKNLAEIIYEVQYKVQAPIGLIASSMLSSMAIACQGAINVQAPTGETIPTSLFVVTIAESGERKTGTDKIFTQAIREFEEQQKQQYADLLKTYLREKYIWDLQKEDLDKSMRYAIKNNEDLSSLRDAFDDLTKKEPLPPRQLRLLYSNATIGALLKNLSENWPAGTIQSSEGLSVLESRTFQSLGPFNELWDGDTYINIDRMGSDSYELQNARLSISLMMQHQPFSNFLSKKDYLAVNSGLLSRFLLSMPTSMQGSRVEQKRSTQDNESNALNKFKERMHYWLKKSAERIKSNQAYDNLDFSPEAENNYIALRTKIEQLINPQRELHGHNALASKLGNNLARIAALIHAFDATEETISAKTLNSAWYILQWYTAQHLKFIKTVKNEPSDEDMGNVLLQWLERHNYHVGHQFLVRHIYQKATSSIRGKEKTQRAIANLESRGLIYNNKNDTPKNIILRSSFPPNTGISPLPSNLTAHQEAFGGGGLRSDDFAMNNVIKRENAK
ncbi:YfjI family protein [Comamonas sp. MYb21]|uniref:YfjI family protein n=1 Tax=Comamonas sp. MYb21 TaxID=1848648 RepID=UPI00309487DA